MHGVVGGATRCPPCLGLHPGDRPCRVSMGVARETAARALSAFATCQEGVDCYRRRNSTEGLTAKVSLPRPGRACGLRLRHGLGADALAPCPPRGTVRFRVSWCSASRPACGSHPPGWAVGFPNAVQLRPSAACLCRAAARTEDTGRGPSRPRQTLHVGPGVGLGGLSPSPPAAPVAQPPPGASSRTRSPAARRPRQQEPGCLAGA